MPSTAIGRIDYDERTQRLFIDFIANGRRYVYFDVPKSTYNALKSAFAKGTHFNTHIRGRYRHEQLLKPGLSA